MKDAVIIGAGPAGLSAALYILRAGFSTVVIGINNSSLKMAEKIENYFGLEAPISGEALLERGRNQVIQLGGEFIEEQVVSISWEGDFVIITNAQTIHCKTVILATGAAKNKIKIPNLSELEGKGVSYCAVCDAFFYRGKHVAVLGNGEYALHEAQELLPLADHVTLVTNGLEPQVDFPKSIDIIQTPIRQLNGTSSLEEIVFEDDTTLPVSGLFVALGTAKGSDLAKKLGLFLENDKIVVDDSMATALPGVFAAGDCIGGVLQVSTAVGEGARAGISAIKFLRTQKK